jgi:GTP cyclohydrolase I
MSDTINRTANIDSTDSNASFKHGHASYEDSKRNRLKESFANIIETIDEEDLTRESIKKTPERAAEAFMYFTKGYSENLSGIRFI